MRITFWGTRGSIAAPGPETVRYGGNTSCVSIEAEGTWLILDAGTGIRRLSGKLPPDLAEVTILLTHLHLDHIQGLGFFGHLRRPDIEVHLCGPASATQELSARLTRYLSPPLFPVHLRDLECDLHLHEVPAAPMKAGPFTIESNFVIHPGPTVGYRITGPGGVVTYIPDHEPALGVEDFPISPRWTSGHDLAHHADVLIHDGQYNAHEYATRRGWGHSTLHHTVAFARQAEVRRLVPFHHDPGREDVDLDREVAQVLEDMSPEFPVTPAAEGDVIEL